MTESNKNACLMAVLLGRIKEKVDIQNSFFLFFLVSFMVSSHAGKYGECWVHFLSRCWLWDKKSPWLFTTVRQAEYEVTNVSVHIILRSSYSFSGTETTTNHFIFLFHAFFLFCQQLLFFLLLWLLLSLYKQLLYVPLHVYTVKSLLSPR